MDYGFEYFVSNGICTESSYAYTAKDGTCAVSSCTKDSFTISGYTDVSGTSALQGACDKQPVSIAVDANNWSPYSSGIFSNCGTSLDHGVLLAGYTSTYWLVKNSWATTWGESGYIRLAPGNTCGLANEPSYPK
jgi:C1A family cysteine protease